MTITNHVVHGGGVFFFADTAATSPEKTIS